MLLMKIYYIGIVAIFWLFLFILVFTPENFYTVFSLLLCLPLSLSLLACFCQADYHYTGDQRCEWVRASFYPLLHSLSFSSLSHFLQRCIHSSVSQPKMLFTIRVKSLKVCGQVRSPLHKHTHKQTCPLNCGMIQVLFVLLVMWSCISSDILHSLKGSVAIFFFPPWAISSHPTPFHPLITLRHSLVTSELCDQGRSLLSTLIRLHLLFELC